ncbi:target of Nesh-SH3 isoform X57 [Homo sapiens]|uniref:target of Nesh-SH3 isoform X57 n=1 Tax=Homo sapiens TaxID=9606 RepID=UPI0023DF65D4|nr:target of Nesh-SH3 isoform X57 [Homo sapiens]
MRGGKCNMLSSLGCLLLCGSITLALGNAQKLPKGKRPNLKVHINTTSDSILLKFLRPSPNVKLEGLLLGYGSNVSPNQYFPLPAEGKFTEAIVDAEPKYLIVVRPAPPPSQKKSCSGKTRSRKPLQLVVGTLTPSSVFLSWGFLINPHHDWTLPSHCPNDRFYTIRYREKDKEKKWIFQICPATETIVENLKPNTVYEFGVKDNVEGGIWSKIFNHKTVVGSKKVNGKIQSTYDQDHTVPAYVPRKLIPITIIKQVIQNVTHKDSAKSPEKAPLGGVILVHLIIPGLNETTVKLPASLMFEISDALKTQLAKNETLALPAESKTPEVEKISARPTTVTPETVPRSTKPTTSSALDVSETTLASSEKPWIVPTAKISEDSKVLQPQTATYDVFSSPTTSDEPEISDSYTATSDRILDSIPPKTSRTLEQPRATLAPSETPFVPQKLEIFTSPEMQPTTPAPQQTTSIPSTPKRRPRPKPPRTKPERTTSAGTITPKISKSPEPTWTTPAPGKTQFISLKPKIPLSPEVTHTKPAPEPQTLLPSQSTIGPETPGTKPSTTLAPRKTKRPGRRPRPRPRPKTTPSPEVPKSKPALEPATIQPEPLVPTTASKPSERPKTTHRPDAPQIQPGSKPPKQLLPKPQTTAEPDMPPTKSVSEPVPFETEAPSMTIVPTTDIEPVTVRTEATVTTLAPKTSQRTRTRRPRPKHKTTPRPETLQTKLDFGPITPGTSSAPTTTTKRTRRPHPKPKTTPHPEVPQTKLAPKQTPRAPPKPKTSPRPRIPQTQPVPKVPQRVTAKPKTSPSPEVSYTTPAPLETRGIPFIPMISPSPSQEELQTTLEETDQSTQEPFTTKIPRTTELAKTTQAPHRFYTTVRPRTSDKPHIRPVLNRTTTRPTRPKPSGMPSGNGVGTGVKQAPRPSGADRNVSVDSTHPTKKPGTRRPPLPPRPTHPRRKPLPPNNVTGKPGSAGIISSGPITTPPLRSTPRPTGTPLERIETDIKQPTVPASGEELENITDFSSSPTRETDPLGKPRFKGPHVRYIQKPDNSPCSITDSVKRFPKEEATEGNATSPPQNPPTNLTVVTVEGCPSFVILDWEKPLNDTVTEYEVISRENGSFSGKNKSIQMTNQTFSTVENLKPNTSYEFQVKPKNPLGEGPVSNTVAFSTESADPRVSEPVSAGRDAIWTERPFNSDSYSECKGKQYVKRTWYKKFVGVQLCNSLRYKIYLSDSLTGKFYNIGDQRGHGEDHCQFVDSFLDGRTGQQLTSDQLPIKEGYFRAVRQEPVQFGEIGGHTQINYVQWYECGTTIPGKW